MRQWYCYVGGQQYGPVDDTTLRQWVAEGRLKPTDNVWCEGMAEWKPASTVPGLFSGAPQGQAVAATAAQGYVKPHRGVLILVLSILSWVLCCVCGIIAWVMANNDLREMDAGLMDPEGRSLTQAGRIISMVHVIVSIVGIVLYAIFIMIMIGSQGF